MTISKISKALGAAALAVVLTGTGLGLNQAVAAGKYTWIWASKGTSVASSTAAMAIGHMPRAIRLATEALDGATGPDRVIALHNLCLARLEQGHPAKAEPSCAAALKEAPAAFAPKTERLIVANIARARSLNAHERAVAENE